jgi:lipopolysaccharide export system protein LptA
VRLTARRSDVDKVRRVVRLFDDVVAEGQDFRVVMDSVTYESATQTMTSGSSVRMERARTEGADGGTAFEVSGTGLTAELRLQTMTIHADVEARFPEASASFLSTGEPRPASRADSPDVVITCQGPMRYEHAARRTTFEDNVRVTSAGKVLRCDSLVVLLGQTQATQSVKVTDIEATGGVELRYEGQTARGAQLEWRSVTEAGSLHGDPAVIKTDRFELTGQDLSFYKLNDRFQSDGPGNLVWRPRPAVPHEGRPAAEEAGIGPLRLREDEPIVITWSESMTHDVAAMVAVFTGGVTVRQADFSLACEALELRFEPDTHEVRRLEAQGGVRIHDRMQGEPRQVLCERLIWHAQSEAVELVAAPGQTVAIAVGPNSVTSEHVILADNGDSLECRAPGRLVVESEEGRGAGPVDAEAAEQVVVDWERMMYFRGGSSPLATFAGSVSAARGGLRMASEVLRIAFDDAMQPVEITATGQASVEIRGRQPSGEGPMLWPSLAGADAATAPDGAAEAVPWRLECPELMVLPPTQRLTASQPGRLIVPPGTGASGTIDWSDTMVLNLAEDYAEFKGDVDAQLADATLKGQSLTLEFSPGRELTNVWAEGDVFFAGTQPDAWQLTAGWAHALFAAGSELRQVIARDDVEVRDQTRSLQCRVLQMFFRTPSEGERAALQRATAEDDVRVRYDDRTQLSGGGDRIEWRSDTDTYRLTGSPYAYVRGAAGGVRHHEILINRQSGLIDLPAGELPVQFEANLPKP